MERQAWLDERRSWAEHWYTANAPTLDEQFPPITPTHQSFLARVIDSVPVGGAILDAPCGTGRYFDAILAAGRNVVGADQSAGMLDQARTRHPEVTLRRTRLQELRFEAAFDAAICVDAMEYVPPEDWPTVLANLRRAVRPGGLLYLTVEQIDRSEVDRAYAEAVAAGLPVVMGEHHRRGGGYHHYPTRDQVAAWLAEEQLEVVAEGHSHGSNYAYLHLLVRADRAQGEALADEGVTAAWRAHEKELYSFLVRSTRDPHAAEDLLQEAFLRLTREVLAGRPPRHVRAWLYRAARNLAVDRSRRLGSELRCMKGVGRGRYTGTAVEQPDATYLDREATDELVAALRELTPGSRRAILLAAEGLRGKEIATIIGRSEAATRALLFRARVQSRQRIAA